MSTMRISIAVCAAAVLLLASLGGQFAHADGRLAGIKGLLSGQKSYAILADHLYTATQSAELIGNTKAAGSLLRVRPDSKEDVKQLVQAFSSLKGSSSEPESFCSKDNLANLLRVVEGMRDGGNIRPMKITNAILRLNRIVIDVVGDARELCEPHLTERWLKLRQTKFSDPAMEPRITRLSSVADSFTYEGYILARDPSANYQANSISEVIMLDELLAAKPIDPDEPEPRTTGNTTVIAMQLDEYVYKPCSEFVGFDEVKDVLVPFNDLYKMTFVVSSSLLEKYYKHKDAHRRYPSIDDSEVEARELAFSYQACQRFLATPREDLAKRISELRSLGPKPDQSRFSELGNSIPVVRKLFV